MLASLKAKWLYFWHNHVQKTFGTILAALSGTDLLASLTNYQTDLNTAIGVKKAAALKLACAGIIVWRAASRKPPAPIDAPPPPPAA